MPEVGFPRLSLSAEALRWCRFWCRLTIESDRTLSKKRETPARHKSARPLANAR